MSHHARNRLLIESGLASNRDEANKLRMKIEKDNGSVEDYIKANTKPSMFGPGGTQSATGSNAAEIGEIRALMNQDGLSFPMAAWYRRQLLAEGKSVAEYIGADAQAVQFGPGFHPLAMLRTATELLHLTGGDKDRAIKALEAVVSLSEVEIEEPTQGRGRRGT